MSAIKVSAIQRFFHESLTVICPVPEKVSAITRCPLYSMSVIDRFDCIISQTLSRFSLILFVFSHISHIFSLIFVLFGLLFCTQYHTPCGRTSCRKYCHAADLEIIKLNKENHSHNKRKDSPEGSLVRVLFAAELEFPKTLVPRLPQNTSNVNIKSTVKSKQLYYL